MILTDNGSEFSNPGCIEKGSDGKDATKGETRLQNGKVDLQSPPQRKQTQSIPEKVQSVPFLLKKDFFHV